MSQDISGIAFIIIAITVLMLAMSGFIVLLVILHRNRQLKNRQQLFEVKANYEKAIGDSQLEMQEQTMHYVGQELHDNLGQMLSLVKLNLNNPQPEQIKEARFLLHQAITDMRKLSQSLNMDWARELSISSFIQSELAKINKVGELNTFFQEEATVELSDARHKVILFRMVQECLQNILKHAQANEIHVRILPDEGQKVVLQISDNGLGFNEGLVIRGAGLSNIEQRAALIGAKVSWQLRKPHGTLVKIFF